MTIRKSIDDIQNTLSLRGYDLLSKEYENSSSRLSIQCPKGHIFTKSWDQIRQTKFKNGYGWCTICNRENRKISFLYIKEFLKKEGYDLLISRKEYKRCNIKLPMLCPKGHKCYISWNGFYSSNTRCPECNKKDFLEIKEFIEKEGYTILVTKEEYERDKRLKLKCPRGCVYNTSWNNFQQGHRCKCFTSEKNKKY